MRYAVIFIEIVILSTCFLGRISEPLAMVPLYLVGFVSIVRCFKLSKDIKAKCRENQEKVYGRCFLELLFLYICGWASIDPWLSVLK